MRRTGRPSPLRLRRVRRADVPVLVRHRAAMWSDIGGFDPGAIRREAVAYRRWISRRLGTRRFLGWIAATRDGEVVGSGCVWVVEALPRPGEPQRWRPYILSMYTDPAFLGRGVASSIVRAAVAWARARGFSRITLHGS
ncbi:MAG TPA: GNAT family N-acetyltransferase, partial [Thermoplasmata archaeon]